MRFISIAVVMFMISGIAVSADSAVREVVDFTPQFPNPKINLYRAAEWRQESSYSAMPDGERALRIDWAETPAKRFEFTFASQYRLPDFDTARIRVKVWVPAGCRAKSLNLRLSDKDGEVFQFVQPVMPGPAGWREFCFRLDAAHPPFSWGARKNRKIDFPVRLGGFACDFKEEGGSAWIGFGKVRFEPLTDRNPLVPVLETGNPLHVLKPGEESKLGFRIRNTRRGDTTGVLEYRISDTQRGFWKEGKYDVSLKKGEAGFFPLPRPDLFGIYYADVKFSDSDPAIKPFRKQMRWCYMKPAGPTPGRATGFLFGVQSHQQRDSTSVKDQELEAMAAAWCGAKVIRLDTFWHRIQPKPDRWCFDSFDHSLALFDRYHLEAQPIYCYTVPWAVAKDWKPFRSSQPPKKRWNARPDYKYWTDFIRTFAARYKGRFRFVEVWNEPDHVGFANFSPSEYVELMKIAYRETKAADPEMSVLTGGFTCLPGAFHNLNDPNHMIKTLQNGKGFYDIHAFHGHGLISAYQPAIEGLLKLRKELGVTVPWYANETAVSAIHIGEMAQAVTLFQKFLYTWARGAIGYTWYDLRNDGYDPLENEHNFGLITRDYYPKAAYAVYNTLANLYRNGRYLRDVSLGAQAQGYLFQAENGDLLLAGWQGASGGTASLALLGNVSGTSAQIDLFGNSKKLRPVYGMVVFPVGRRPSTLQISGQSGEPEMLGELIRSASVITIHPGKNAQLSWTLFNPTDWELEFRLDFKLPEGLTALSTEKSFRLKPGAAQTCSFNVSAAGTFHSFYGREKQVTLHLKAGDLWDGEIAYPVQTVTTLPAGDFSSAPNFMLNDVSSLTMLAPNSPDKAHLFWKGAADLSAEVWLACDGDALKLKVVVSDDRHHQPFSGANVWNGDGIQLAFSLPGQRGLWEFGLSRLDSGRDEVFCWSAPKGFRKEQAVSSVRLKTIRDESAGATIYSAEIPFRAIGLKKSAAGKGFRFNLLVNDNDGEIRESYIAIAPGIGESKTPQHFPVINCGK